MSTINGTQFDDTLTGTGGADTIYADQGNDIVHGAGGGDNIFGGEGTDTLYGGAGADYLTAGGYVNLLYGGAGNDTLGGNGSLYGGAGDDVLDGGGVYYSHQPDDHLYGGPGNDTANYYSGIIFGYVYPGISVNLAAKHDQAVGKDIGYDQLFSIENVTGTPGNDTIKGNAGANVLDGKMGDDIISGGAGDDTIDGGAGGDFLNGHTIPSGDDTLFGGAGNDQLDGQEGNDVLNGGPGDDTMFGGTGNDLYIVDSSYDAVVDFDNQGSDTVKVSAAQFITPSSIEKLVYTGSADFLGGVDDPTDTKIIAGPGNDTIDGAAGHGTLIGHGGNDVLYSGSDADTLIGGAGTDIVNYGDSHPAGVTADLATPANNTGFAQGDVYVSIEGLFGSRYGDDLRGNAHANSLSGGDGKDRLSGRGGDDVLDGGNGADTLDGGSGSDTIIGGKGRDVLTGGFGADHFVFNSLKDSAAGNHRDHITDFHKGSDKIDLSGIDAMAGVAGDQAFHFIAGAFTGHEGELHAAKHGANTIVSGDVDGDGHADFSILLEGVHSLQSTDFLM